jgi:hypothetical protein
MSFVGGMHAPYFLSRRTIMLKKLWNMLFGYEEAIFAVPEVTVEDAETPPDDTRPFITFYFDDELKVQIQTHIPKSFVNIMLKNKVISPGEDSDETLLHYAMVVLANEVSEQLVMNLNEKGGLGE